ncbi:MAG: hypothetical protein NTW97_04570 [Candidatus Krumholzibacteria bacterium]|nr:hypothetical protein [Candidatus Krumholzibacteria bacterium]
MLKSPASLSRIMILAVAVCCATASACRSQILEDIRLVDSPTAGILPHGGYLFYGGIGPESSILAGIEVGFFDRVMLGASFGFQKFIGRGDIDVNKRPGFEIRARLIEESTAGPAVALGIDTQGEDAYLADAQRYERKSKGLYAVVSKNYRLIEDLSIHGGVNYSFEVKDERGVNVFGGLSLEIVKGFSVLLDYNAALDDNDAGVATHRTRGRGYLDSGLRFDYRDNLRFKFFFKDLLDTYVPESGVKRSIEVFYISSF